MSRDVEELFAKASGLPAGEHSEPAGLLLESIEDLRDECVEEAWAVGIERRMADYRAGRVKTIPWSEVRDNGSPFDLPAWQGFRCCR